MPFVAFVQWSDPMRPTLLHDGAAAVGYARIEGGRTLGGVR